MRFYGNEICCGSYACLNAMQDKNIDVQLFEISTTAPFGIRHYREQNFDRLLTTFCDPNQGIDRAFEIWGYEVKKYQVPTPQEAIEIIRHNSLSNRVVLGPVDMGGLKYQIIPSLLNRMDHYITLECLSEESVLCFDSEGFYGYPLSYSQLEKCISVAHVIEARGIITLRVPSKKMDYLMREVLSVSLKNAMANMQNAELTGYGSWAFIDCYRYLSEYEMYKWRLPLMYDIEYLLQRKRLFSVLLDACGRYRVGKTSALEEIESLLQGQWDILGRIYMDLWSNKQIEKRDFERLSKVEGEIAAYRIV